MSIHQLNQPGLLTWAAISAQGIIGPFFFDDTVNGESFLEMLNNFIIPHINLIDNNRNLIFQQDGAPAHYDRRVRQLLTERFSLNFIGRGAPIKMPPRSPDLTPMDYSIWGLIKDNVYSRHPTTLIELRQFIIDEFEILNNNLPLITKIVNSVYGRLWNCLIAGGSHFEHFL